MKKKPAQIKGGKFPAESVAVRTGELVPIPPKIKLSSIDDCRLEMARVYRQAKARQIDSSEASRLVFILAQIGRLIEVGLLEQRLTELERKLLP